MRVISARNVHEAFMKGVYELQHFGILRDSRNGPVLVMPSPVTTVYEHPEERVIFWPHRDANPFFHLYESLWMLAGHNDLKPLLRYAKNMENYSDDGRTIHGAYGYRWHHTFGGGSQIDTIISRLTVNPDDRRCVLQMWDPRQDLGRDLKDVPCNVTATFQRDFEGRLDLTVFCRSNDIIWGAYGANAVHFSMLQEYVARSIDCPVGVYNQVSVNWHAYVDVLKKLIEKGEKLNIENYTPPGTTHNPYVRSVIPTPMPQLRSQELNELIFNLVSAADLGFPKDSYYSDDMWYRVVFHVLKSHHIYKETKDVKEAIQELYAVSANFDWVRSAYEWFERRA